MAIAVFNLSKKRQWPQVKYSATLKMDLMQGTDEIQTSGDQFHCIETVNIAAKTKQYNKLTANSQAKVDLGKNKQWTKLPSERK